MFRISNSYGQGQSHSPNSRDFSNSDMPASSMDYVRTVVIAANVESLIDEVSEEGTLHCRASVLEHRYMNAEGSDLPGS